MPHLSALHWTTLTLIFMFIFILLLVKAWWQNTPSYKQTAINTSLKTSFKNSLKTKAS